MGRFPLLLSFSLLSLSLACGGARSNELFAQPGEPAAEHAATEPSPPNPANPASPVDPEPSPRGTDGGIDLHDATPDSGTGTSTFQTFGPCDRDVECDQAAGQVCNWKLDVCATLGPVGTPCGRDGECITKLCNWKLDACATPAALGEKCGRDEECVSKLCNWKLDACALKGATGAACGRDQECASGVCNTATDTCK
jgi:hypothetical protein